MTLSGQSWYARHMNARAYARSAAHYLAAATLLLSVTTGVLGCNQESAKASEEAPASSAQAIVETPSQPAIAEATGQASYKEDAFQLSLEGPGQVKVGQLTTLKVILKAQNGYKVNDEYPIKFKFAATKGAKAEKEIVRKDDAVVEKMTAVLPVKVTATQAGKITVSGKLSFSVCTDERCLIEKRDLALEINAS